MSNTTKLYDLPDSEFATGGKIDRLAKRAGYASGRAWANDGCQWNATVEEAIEMLVISDEGMAL